MTKSTSADLDRQCRENDSTCQTPGCDAQHTWLHADHRTPRAKHGPTALVNLDMLCAPDNKNKNDGPPMARRNDD